MGNLIAAGAQQTVNLPAGGTLAVAGTGTYQIYVPQRPDVATSQLPTSSAGTSIGPFDCNATVRLVATSALSFDVLGPGDVLSRSGRLALTAAQAASTQALVSGAWIPVPGGQVVAAIGDSLQANGIGSSPVGFGILVQSPLNWGCALLKQALWLPVGATAAWSSGLPDLINYSLAVSGTTTQQVIDSQIGPAVLLKAHWWSVLSGTNDLTLRAADTAVQTCNRLRTICQTGIQSGAKIALWTIPPRNEAQWVALNASIVAAGSTIAKQKLKQMAVNTWIRRYAQETPGVVLIDPYNELVDPASAQGEWLAAYTFDGTHWNGAGCYVAGQVFATAMRPFIKPALFTTISQLDVYNGIDNVSGDFAVTRGLQGTGGTLGTGVTGTAPTGWTIDPQAGSFTAVAAAQARTDSLSTGTLANGRELQIAVSTAGAASQLRVYQASTGAVIPAGIPFYCETELSVSANSAVWQGPSLQMFFNSGTPAVNCVGMFSDGSSLPLGAIFDAVIRTPIMRSTGAAGGLAFTQMNLITSSVATMKIRRIGFRALDPAMPGLVLSAA
jgi:hypothetical protein